MTSLATIYKTVTLLKEMGEVSELPQEVAQSTGYQIVSHRQANQTRQLNGAESPR